MAEPIKPTPVLEGEDAIRFIKELVETNKKISPEAIKEAKRKAFSIKFKIVED